MATKKGKQAYDFVVAALKRNNKVEFATVRDAAARKGITLYPIVYGRAKAALGLVPSRKRGEAKAAREKAAASSHRGPGRPRKTQARRGPGRPPKSRSTGTPLDAVRELAQTMQETGRENTQLRATLEKIRDLIDRAL